MAFILHWPNTYADRATDRKVGSLTPALSLQADVLLPNALAGVRGLLEGSTVPAAPGCKGNQLDNEFPLIPRLPLALPMIQYPTNTRGPDWQQQDMCAVPVLNWESYVKGFRASCASIVGTVYPRKARQKPRETQIQTNTEVLSTTNPDSANLKKYFSGKEAKSMLLHNTVDLEVAEKEPVRNKGRPKKLLTEQPLPKAKLKIHNSAPSRNTVPIKCLDKYKNQPEMKVMGTWNYLYGGHGACDWCYDSGDKTRRNLYVGNGSKLRMVSLKPSRPTQLLSTFVASIWEESEVSAYPRNCKPATDEEALSNVILQIKAQKKRNVIGVQRGKSIGIYDQQGIPALLCTLPNICYGTKHYIGWNSSQCKPNPRLLSFDFNCNALSELVTVDENQIVQFLDLSAEKVVLQTKGQDFKSTGSHFPEMDLNASGGVAYAADHPHVIYHWTNSQISLHDHRVSPGVTQTTELLNLRNSPSSFSWSDQQIFNTNCGKSLNEYISCLKPSENVIHYYVGTTNRVFLMDMRVPKNPVVKFSHGMKGPAAYLDVLNDENYEILVGGCQRTSEIFCANFDTTHLSCVDRTECKARNPILQSYPRHLLSSRNFFEFAEEGGFGFNYEADHKRVKDHFDAWTTGLCIMKPISNFKWNPSGPHPFLLFSGNSFGDIFCQEWEQKPSESSQRPGGTETNDPRLTSVMSQWKSSMESTEIQEFHRTSQNPYRSVDCDLLIESSAHSLKHSRKIRTKRFDPFTPSTLTYNRVRDGLPSLDEQIAKLRHINSQRVQKFLNVWTDTDGDSDYEPLPPNPGNIMAEPTHSTTLHEAQEDIPEEEENRADFVQLKEEINEEFYMETVDTDVEIDDDENSTPFQDCLTGDYGMEDLINQQSDLPTIDESSVYFVKPELEL